jgi:hypothetical protein
MSIAAMNWAWRQVLAPTVKLVLMSMADAADDQGVCWPGVPTLARKCCVSERTVRRIMGDLETNGLIRRDSRFRNDGSQTSNRYLLALDRGEKLSAPPDTGDRVPGQPCQSPTDTDVHPGTTSESSRNSPPPQRKVTKSPALDHAGASDGGGHRPDWIYPPGLSEAERHAAGKRLSSLPPALAQPLLDELTGRMASAEIRIAPLAYLRGLIQRARDGTFAPEAALRVAESRTRRQQAELRQQQAVAISQRAVPIDVATGDHPIARRIEAIRRKARQGSEGGR